VTAVRSNKFLLTTDCVLVAKLNPHIPRIWRVRYSTDMPAVASTEFLPVVPNEAEDLDFLYQACSDTPFLTKMAELVTGTSTSHQRVRADDLLGLSVPLPPSRQRRHIGRVLSLFDDRVASRSRVASLCEEMGAIRYREAVRRIGTERQPLRETADIERGVSYRRDELGEGGGELVTLKCVGRNGEFRPEGVKPFNGKYKASQVICPADVVVAVTDLTQHANVLGRAIRFTRKGMRPRIASLDLAIVRPHADGVAPEWLYLSLKSEDFRRHARAHANGTTVLHLARSAFEEYAIPTAKRTAGEAFARTVKPLLAASELGRSEAFVVGQARNVLRARLLRGRAPSKAAV
jgi:type I restriction enzyme S subunit